MPRRPLDIEITRTSDGSKEYDILTDPVPPKERWFIQHSTLCDLTSDITRVHIGVKKPRGIVFYDEECCPTSCRPIAFPITLVLEPGDRLIGRFIDSSPGDQLKMIAVGFAKEI